MSNWNTPPDLEALANGLKEHGDEAKELFKSPERGTALFRTAQPAMVAAALKAAKGGSKTQAIRARWLGTEGAVEHAMWINTEINERHTDPLDLIGALLDNTARDLASIMVANFTLKEGVDPKKAAKDFGASFGAAFGRCVEVYAALMGQARDFITKRNAILDREGQ